MEGPPCSPGAQITCAGLSDSQRLPDAVARRCSRHAKLLLRKGKDEENAPNDPVNYSQVWPVLHWEERGRSEEGRERSSNVIWKDICVK